MSDGLHECPHPQCARRIRLDLFACGPHWFGLPSAVRSGISRAWAGVRHGVIGALDEHDAAVERALDYWGVPR
jgi:hypothetical protein